MYKYTKKFSDITISIKIATLISTNFRCGALLIITDNDYFGSDFTKIMRVGDILNEQGFIRPDFVDFDDCSNLGKEMGTLDDITTYEDWQPGAEAFKDLNICLALHNLNAYQPYSLADILRMNKFCVTETVKQVMTM